ncbi:MAG: dimethyl sulfoxide reductase anchor subunit [Puniceicoccaceae bacterium]|nr:dimethyl sulfoxide reductase anchor subunit [Puniceicoccaceae bacterium]
MLLKEQGTLQTPVGTFSKQHEAGMIEPEQAQFYKQLIPLSKLGAGEQYAFQVDLDKCTGCKACVSACHSLNGLEEDETWRDVGTIHGVDLSGASYTQTVTTACHHCADPGCLNGCPVLAYEKDPETGIVHHLDDQCIGCQYCALKCPYDVPKYSKKLGIVRKCDMCHNRLAEGEAPACVQACPTEAIRITIVDTSAVALRSTNERDFLAAAPEPSYTQPTTQYITKREIPDQVEAADLHALKPEHAHMPLVCMLVLTQFSVGLYAASALVPAFARSLALVAFVAMALGLAASTAHLGRPLGAWRAFLGLRRSWLSREIVVFFAFSNIAAAYTGVVFFGLLDGFALSALAWLNVIIGLTGVFTSVMIYHDTQRPFWARPITAAKFYGTLLSLPAAFYLIVAADSGSRTVLAIVVLLVALLGKVVLDLRLLAPASAQEMTPARKSALLMLRPLRVFTFARFGFVLATLVSLAVYTFGEFADYASIIGFVCLLASELLERILFFKAVAAPKMPGGITT